MKAGLRALDFGLRGRLLPWLVSGVLGLALLGGAGWFLAIYPWVPFRPVCPLGRGDQRTFLEQHVHGPWRLLDGPLRENFRRVGPRGTLQDHRTTHDGIYVTIEYYLDLDTSWNYTSKGVRKMIVQELNPDFYDGFGKRKNEDFERLKEKFGYIPSFDFNNLDCDVVKFFTIDGADPLADIEGMLGYFRDRENPEEDIRSLCIVIDRIKSQERPPRDPRYRSSGGPRDCIGS